jgi:hypothetical protein
MNDYTPKLQRLAQLASEHHALLASLLAIYQGQEELNEGQLAAFLQGAVDSLPLLALCHRPRTDNFRPDVEQIAAYAGVNALQLAKLVRAATAYEERRRVGGSGTHTLLAARDRDEADEPDELQDSTDV